MAPLRVGALYFSSVLFSILSVSFFIEVEIDGASAGVYGLIGGHIGNLYSLFYFVRDLD
jgi:hypothetical protein